MSKYRRDDKQFREQINKLADSGLKFPTAPFIDEMEHKMIGEPGSLTVGTACSLYRARPCSECVEVNTIDLSKMVGETRATLEAHGFSTKDYPVNFNDVPAYARVVEPARPVYEIAPKGKLPEFVAGIVTGAALLAGLTFLVKIIMMIGGAH